MATEMVLARELNVAIPDWMTEEAKQSTESIRLLKLRLRQNGYYRGAPNCVRPLADRLMKADAHTVLDEFEKRFGSVDQFGGVHQFVTTSADATPTDGEKKGIRERAADWLNQFETDDFINCGLDLLARAKVLRRQDAVEAVRQFLREHPEFKEASVVPLSKGAESSQIVQYYAADMPEGFKFYPSLKDAAGEGRKEPVLFVDDFCGSGGQVTDILAAWFNNPELRRQDLHEQRTLALDPEREFLVDRKLGIVFVAGWSEGLTQIRTTASAIGIDCKVFAP